LLRVFKRISPSSSCNQHHGFRHLRRADLLAAQGRDFLAVPGQFRLQTLITLIAHATGAAHQFDRVILGKAFADPVTALLVADALPNTCASSRTKALLPFSLTSGNRVFR
jgi:hypothetical protein